MRKGLMWAIALCALAMTATTAKAQVVLPGGVVAENTQRLPLYQVLDLAADSGVPFCTSTDTGLVSERDCTLQADGVAAGCNSRSEDDTWVEGARSSDGCSVQVGDTAVGATCESSWYGSSRGTGESGSCTTGPVTIEEHRGTSGQTGMNDHGTLDVRAGDAGVHCTDDDADDDATGPDGGYHLQNCTVTGAQSR